MRVMTPAHPLWLILVLLVVSLVACSIIQLIPATPIIVTQIVPVTQLVTVPTIVIVEVTRIVEPTEIPVHAPINDDTLMFLSFQESEGATIFRDSSVYGNDAFCLRSACPAKGELGMNFNGLNNYLLSPVSIQGLSSFTLAGWFYARSYEDAGKIPITFYAPGIDCPRVNLRIGGGFTEGPVLFVADEDNCAPQEIVGDPDFLALNQWYHIAVVYNSITDRHAIFVNGELVALNEYPVDPIPDTTPGQQMNIGVNYSPRPEDRRWWDGYIDQLALYHQALSREEIKNLYLYGLRPER